MKIAVDTNVLVRAIVADDPKQARMAQDALAKAQVVALGTVAMCEFAWVLARGYRATKAEIGAAIRGLVASANVEANFQAIEAGLSVLDAGGDFADGVIAFEGAALGAETFASFDKDAVKLLQNRGQSAALLA